MKRLKLKQTLSLLLTVITVATSLISVSAEDELSISTDYDWERFKGKNVSINVYNWGEYIAVDDGEEGAFDTNKAFEELTGIKVNYSTYASNEELYAKLKNGGSAYDLIIPSDYMIARMIKEGMVEKLNYDNIPNFAHIMDRFKGLEYDPKDQYSVAYMWGSVGLIYNTTLIEEGEDMETWSVLWSEKYVNDILMFSNSRDAFGIALKRLGYSFNTTDEFELKQAAQALKEQKVVVQAYVADEIFDKMGGGEAAIAPYYAGDAITMIDENPDLAFATPREGTNLFVDAMTIPKGAKNKEAAEMYINFMCETLVGIKNVEYIGYSTPHAEVFVNLDEEITSNPIAYLTDEQMNNMEVYLALPDATTTLIDSLWTEVLGMTNENPYLIPIFMLFCIGSTVIINLVRKKKKQSQYQG